MQKFLLCRPRGGLNDVLCQIEICWRYADEFNRRLIVDTTDSCLAGPFSDYFEINDPSSKAVFDVDDQLIATLDDLTCFPVCVQGRLSDYESVETEDKKHLESKSSVPLRFDLAVDYDEDVLLHEQSGGGTKSFNLLSRLRFSDELSRTVTSRTRHLPDEYAAVHVRHTDYSTDYLWFFEKIKKRVVDMTLLICSDDRQVVETGTAFFERSRVVTVSDIPNTAGKPLHLSDSHDNAGSRKDSAINSLVDLVALGMATRFYFTIVDGGFPSGFSRLAAHLSDNKDVLEQLLGERSGTLLRSGSRSSRRILPLRTKMEKALPRPLRKIL